MSFKDKTRADVVKFTEMVAAHNKWKLLADIDPEFYEMLVDGLLTNAHRYGYYSCPCRAADGERPKDKDIICPCDYCGPDVEEFGYCYCGLYMSEAAHGTGEPPKAIPERRPES